MSSLFRVLVFQSLWFLFAYWGNWEYQYLAPIVAILAVHIDWYFFRPAMNYARFSFFIGFVLLTGILLDSLLALTGFIKFQSTLSPFNMWAIWIIFVPYYQFAFEKFYQKLQFSIPLSLIGAPMAYSGGAKISGFMIAEYGLIAIALAWCLFFPLSVHIYYGFLLKQAQK